MTQSERKELAEQIGMVAVFYGYEIEQARLTLILNYWASTNIAPPLIKNAYKRFMEESKIHKLPTPAEILSILRPKVDSHDFGVLVAARVLKAVSLHGWCNPVSAREYIGEEGWAAVKVFGGWEHICQNLGVTIDMTTFQAQCREIVKSEHKVAEINGNSRLALNSPTANKTEEINHENVAKIHALFQPKEF